MATNALALGYHSPKALMAYHPLMDYAENFDGYRSTMYQHTYGSQSMSNHWGQPIGHGHPPAQGIVSLEAPRPNYTSYDNQNTFIAEQHAPSPAFGKSEYTPYEGQNNFVPETRGPTPGVAVPNAVLPSLDTIPPTPAATPEVKATARKALISIETVYHRFTESRALRDSFDGHCRAYKNGDTTEAEFYMALYRLLYFNKAADLIPILKTLMPQSWKAEDVEWFDKAIEEDVERVGGLRSLRVKLVVAKTARKGRKGKKEGSLVVKLPIRGLGKRKKV